MFSDDTAIVGCASHKGTIWKMGRPSLTLSSGLNLTTCNINTSKMKEIKVLSFKAVFCWEGGTEKNKKRLVKKTSSVIG